jgi:hypothetical protein
VSEAVCGVPLSAADSIRLSEPPLRLYLGGFETQAVVIVHSVIADEGL